jgi:hypothetical protein
LFSTRNDRLTTANEISPINNATAKKLAGSKRAISATPANKIIKPPNKIARGSGDSKNMYFFVMRREDRHGEEIHIL